MRHSLARIVLGIAMIGAGGAAAGGAEPADSEPAQVALRGRRPAKDSDFESRAYLRAIERTSAMVSDSEAVELAGEHGLQILNLTWEDTGRYKGSSVGPNISDMTIQVGAQDPKTDRFKVTCMPVIRHPNFQDRSCDLDPRDFTILVGNQTGRRLKRISLHDFLENPTAYLSEPESWKSRNKSLICERDSKVLVSAQACFLPVPKNGKAEFNPVLFNYQSRGDDPAVLTVLATREGTSVTVIDNQRDAFAEGPAWGQRLFHNANGERASLTGERESESSVDCRASKEAAGADPCRDETGLNMVLLVQIPLKQKHPMRFKSEEACDLAAPAAALCKESRRSDVENAVIGHGEVEGPFTEIDGLEIERDERFPVRVTVQFYKATSNGVVSEADMAQIAAQIERVYAHSDAVGSLVTGGKTGRVTEYDGAKVQPRDWWRRFWERHEADTGQNREEGIRNLRRLLGRDYEDRPVTDLYLRSILRGRHAANS